MSDVLQRASKALRDSHTGANSGSGFTRARILRSLFDGKRKRWSRWAVLGPLAALLLGGTAWAGATGRLPAWWTHAEQWVTTLNGPNQTATAEVELARKLPQRGSLLPSPSIEPAEAVATAPIEPPSIEPPEPALEEPPLELAPLHTPRAARRATALEPSREPDPPSEAARDPELVMFRRAHDLHFKSGAPSAAVAAYGEYLAAYPRGRFVPEARYNTALGLLKMGERERARGILETFARGEPGSYRQAEATKLLEALAR
jgi:hypothetical protein